MKKRIAGLLTALVLTSAGAFAQTNLDDVQANSWEYKTVAELGKAGLIQQYSAAAFAANQNLTRMQVAGLVAQALQNAPQANVSQKTNLMILAKKFRPELEQIAKAKGIDISPAFKKPLGKVELRYMHGPILTDVKPGSLNGMYAKVGPDVKEAIANNPMAQKAIIGSVIQEVNKELPPDLKPSVKTLTPLINHLNTEIATAGNDVVKKQLELKKGIVESYKTLLDANATAEDKKKASASLLQVGENAKKINDFNRQKTESQFDTRLYVNLFGIAEPQTKALVRAKVDMRFGKPDAVNFQLDRLMLAQSWGNTTLVLGRQGIKIGNGLAYNDFIDGALLNVKNGDTNYTVAYGRPTYYTSQYARGEVDPATMAYVLHGADGHLRASVAQVSTKIGKEIDVKAYYMNGRKGIPVDAYGLAVDYKHNKFWVGGEFAKLLKADKLPQPYGLLASLLSDRHAWVAGVGYGDFNSDLKGTWDVKLRYLFEGRVAPVMNPYTFNQPFIDNYKAWNVEANYALQKGMSLNFSAFLNGKSVKNTEKYHNTYSLTLSYNF